MIEVLIFEDHLTLRKGLELLLAREGMRVAGVASTVREARALLERRRHDAVLVDLTLADGDVLPLLHDHLASDQEAAVVIHTGAIEPERLALAAHSGARGFVLKTAPPQQLIEALTQVAAGGTWIDPTLARLITPRAGGDSLAALTPREREILEQLADGLTGEEVAGALVLSPETIRTHIRNAMVKLGARTRVQAVAMVVGARPLQPLA
jgi:DNA-binding NarL/FixJ family response regulator